MISSSCNPVRIVERRSNRVDTTMSTFTSSLIRRLKRRRDSDTWDSFDDFSATFDYWHQIDCRVGKPLFEKITVDGSQVAVRNGAGQPMNSEGYLEYLVRKSGTGFIVSTFEISRGERASRTLEEFSSFLLAGKFLIATEIAIEI